LNFNIDGYRAPSLHTSRPPGNDGKVRRRTRTIRSSSAKAENLKIEGSRRYEVTAYSVGTATIPIENGTMRMSVCQSAKA